MRVTTPSFDVMELTAMIVQLTKMIAKSMGQVQLTFWYLVGDVGLIITSVFLGTAEDKTCRMC